MSGRKKKIPGPDGQLHDGTVVHFNSSAEHWTELLLDDGTVVKVKLVVTEVVRFDNAYDAEGNPVYLVKSTNITTVDSPDDLRRPQQ